MNVKLRFFTLDLIYNRPPLGLRLYKGGLFFLAVAVFVLVPFSSFAVFDSKSPFGLAPYGMIGGYTDDVSTEVSNEPQEMLLVERPPILDGPNFHDIIFNSELSREFLIQYQQKFGRTEQEENYFLVNRQGYYMSPGGLSATQVDSERRLFAEYMMRRLIEFHTENVMKNDPQFKKVYEIKQAMSNVKVEVNRSTHFDMSYSFVGNFWRGILSSPYGAFYSSVQMDPGSLLPTDPKEIFVSYNRSVFDFMTMELTYVIYSKRSQVVLNKVINPNISVNLMHSLNVAGTEIDYTKEILTIAGITITF